MNRMTFGIVAGGGAVAAFLTATAANADSWTPVYDTDSAVILQDSDPSSLTWSLPATFTHGTTTLTGTNYLTESASGFDNQFVTDGGDVYNQSQLFPGVTNLYYDPAGASTPAVDFIKTPLGTFDISPLASLFTPTDFSAADPASLADALSSAGLYGALDLALPSSATPGAWTPTYDTADAVQLQDGDPSSFTWSVPSTFVNGATTLTGTTYLTQSLGGLDTQFVTDSGAVYNQDQLFPGFTNLYFDDPTDTTGALDFLKTPLGTFDISWAASLFTPTDFSDAVAASPVDALTDAGLFGALDLGLPAV